VTAPTPTPNAELAYKVLDHIDADPASWDQYTWFSAQPCGTVACFAGWTVMLSGHTITPADPDSEWFASWSAIDGDEDAMISEVAAKDLGIEGMPGRCPAGCHHCGFTESASKTLFEGTNSRERLGELVAEIFGPRPGVTA
jgi:hypothetical protein